MLPKEIINSFHSFPYAAKGRSASEIVKKKCRGRNHPDKTGVKNSWMLKN
jgi:hypothetical protein